MKFKLIQIATLVIFVMSVVYMAHIPNGYGGPITDSEGNAIVHDVSSHNPNFYIDACGHRKDGATDDPRGDYFNVDICGVDGDEYVSEKGWYYRGSGEISGSHGPNTPGHKKPNEQVYRLNLNGSASAAEYMASGSLSPSLDYMAALPREYDSWGGTGHIHLEITELDYHKIIGRSWNPDFCVEKTACKHEWKPTDDAEMAVNVHPTEKVETKTSAVYGEASAQVNYKDYGHFSGSFGGSYSQSWSEKQTGHLTGISYGIVAHVGVLYDPYNYYPEIKLQAKEAVVSGDIDTYATVSMTANYAQAESTLCPYNTHVNQDPIEIPHAY